MKRIELQTGFVLHVRPWRDSSLLVEFFSRRQGRVSLLAKGARGRKTRGGNTAALLQPFGRVSCSWSGRGDLKTLTHCEAEALPLGLAGQRLYSALYVNELLVRLLHHDDPHEDLFDLYQQVLQALAQGGFGEPPGVLGEQPPGDIEEQPPAQNGIGERSAGGYGKSQTPAQCEPPGVFYSRPATAMQPSLEQGPGVSGNPPVTAMQPSLEQGPGVSDNPPATAMQPSPEQEPGVSDNRPVTAMQSPPEQQQEVEEQILRRFEFALLDALGYGFDLGVDGTTGKPVNADNWYHYRYDCGMVLASAGDSEREPRYRGSDLQRIQRGELGGPARQCAKQLMRQALAEHLGPRPLNSRELFRRMQ